MALGRPVSVSGGNERQIVVVEQDHDTKKLAL